MNEKVCDHKSAGVLVENDEKILIIERKKFPAGFALPAGHLDSDSFLDAAFRELQEETGIEALKLELLLNEEVQNPCRRENGTHHQWQVFRASNWKGDLKPSEDETKTAEWASRKRVLDLAERTETFAKKYEIPISDISNLTTTLSNDPEWQSSPGLEPVWHHLLGRIEKA
ncbi:MAG: NUDIX hydrolase [Candidatus Sungbacteria bacterium]|nr:NUDIX hydrolase [Candidatus Sungbacteria bacterium]